MTPSDPRTRIPALPFVGLITSASLPNLTLGFLKCKTVAESEIRDAHPCSMAPTRRGGELPGPECVLAGLAHMGSSTVPFLPGPQQPPPSPELPS
ncbi:unnamed protein product [Rangifer tarandus platyrhynchus]|uniref:Uncharacterized protein n=1 Tax=Rangifer tarandus platyrhynchus TaxID=3082113 RepID=A0AC59Y3X8_RANTA